MKGVSVLSKERLTERRNGRGFCPENIECTPKCEDCDHMEKMMNKLAEYEDLEEQNLLLRLPVAVGSKVYEIIEDTVPEHHFYIEEYEVQDVSVRAIKYADDWYSFDFPNLYFSRAEAEKKLRELEGK